MACKKCNSCEDLGCAPLVYPKCILTEVAYPCIGVAAGVTGTALLTAINSKFCSIANSIASINSAILLVQGDITTVEADITTIEGDITTIQGDITTINTTLGTLSDETWKTIGAVGNMINGEAIPAFDGDVTLTVLGRLRKTGINHSEINLFVNVEVSGLGIGAILTLPATAGGIAYRPTTALQYSISCLSSSSTDTAIGFIRVLSSGVLTLNVQPLAGSTDTNWVVNFNALIPTD